MTREEIMTIIEEQNVHFSRLQFVDIFGFMKNIAIPLSQINKALDGVKNKLAAPVAVNADIFEMTPAEKEATGIVSLPGSLEDAVVALQESPIARETLGEHIFSKYIEGKKQEWHSYRTWVTDWETKTYIKNY